MATFSAGCLEIAEILLLLGAKNSTNWRIDRRFGSKIGKEWAQTGQPTKTLHDTVSFLDGTLTDLEDIALMAIEEARYGDFREMALVIAKYEIIKYAGFI